MSTCTFKFLNTRYSPLNITVFPFILFDVLNCFFASDVQHRRTMYRQQHQEETTLKRTTEFVESYLSSAGIWNFEDEDQNILTYEVCAFVSVFWLIVLFLLMLRWYAWRE